MRLVLTDNFIMPEGGDASFFDVHPHIGLISLGAVAQRDNHKVVVYDPKREIRFGHRRYDRDFYRKSAEDILALRPEAVGFTTLGCSFLYAVKVAELLKQKEPDLTILLGGPHATMLAKEILEAYWQFDVIVRHEAEETLPQVLTRVDTRDFYRIPGISWRVGRIGIQSTPGLPKIEDLDTLPLPAYDLYPVEDLELKLMRVEAGRGCPFHCTFCSTASFFQRSFRLKSPERLLYEMDFLHNRYNVSEFKLDHDLFTVDRRKVAAFCEVVQNRSYKWRVSARTDCVDKELLEKMALAGCIGLYFGIETGSKRMQQLSQKRLKLEGVEQILDVTQSLGIEATVSFITGYPEELSEDQADTLNMIGSAFQRPPHLCTPQLHILVPEPGTPLFKSHSNSLRYDGYVTKFNARLLDVSDLEEIQAHPELYSTYYYYPAAMPRTNHTFAVDAVDVLRAAGHEILSYALRFYDGELSGLIASFQQWVQNEGLDRIDSELALKFISECFGPAHHLTSLFRFGFAMSSLPPTNIKVEDRNPNDGTYQYRLNPKSLLLTEIHDCCMLLKQIRKLSENTQPLAELNTGGRSTYLITAIDSTISQFCVNSGIEAVLSLFEVPRRLCDVAFTLRQLAADNSDEESLLADLVAAGALIPFTENRHQSVNLL